jgi:O-antigen ligase
MTTRLIGQKMLNKIYSLDLFMLSLLILSLPSLEGPKHIFLVGYLITRTCIEIAEINLKKVILSYWDYIFILIILTALLSTIYAGMPKLMGKGNLEEWKGYRVLLTAILTGWFLSRSNYTIGQYNGLFKLIIIGAIPPLLWGLYQYLVIHTKSSLELHSVGHVNHSAIYLVMIFGATLGYFLTKFNNTKKNSAASISCQILLAIFSLLFFLSIIIGQSRGAFIFAILLGLLILFLIPKTKKIKIIGLITLIGILSLTYFLKVGIVEKQINYQKNNNVLSYRDRVWNVSIEASRFSPLLGIGMSNWHFITLDHLKNSVESRHGKFNPDDYGFPGHSHNLYLTALVERGLIGLLITLIFMGAWIGSLIKTYRQALKSNISSNLWVGSFSAWVATFGIGTVNTTFHHEHAILACLFFGLYLSYARIFLKLKIKNTKTIGK